MVNWSEVQQAIAAGILFVQFLDYARSFILNVREDRAIQSGEEEKYRNMAEEANREIRSGRVDERMLYR
ncbi:hypothetical protein BJX76DRAFT_334561 [Aspergillus varians]